MKNNKRTKRRAPRFPFDQIYKAVFAHPKTVADLLSGYVGEPNGPLPTSLIAALDFRTLRQMSPEWIKRRYRTRLGDQAWYVEFRAVARGQGYPPFMLIHIEFQSRVDPRMALRFHEYAAEMLRAASAQKLVAAKAPYPPVLCVVVYKRRRPWRAPTQASALFQMPPGVGPAPAGPTAFYPWGPHASLTRAVIGVSTLVARLPATPVYESEATAAVPPDATWRYRRIGQWRTGSAAGTRTGWTWCTRTARGSTSARGATTWRWTGERFEEPVRSFGSDTDELERMAQWLHACGVRVVAMEATGVYWIPPFEVLERSGLEVHLVNPRATRPVSGRKSDVLDCQWIRQLMSYGLLRGAYRVPDEVCAMRAYLRQRDELVRQRSRAVRHMQALVQMNVQLDNVLSDVMGKDRPADRARHRGGRTRRGGAGRLPRQGAAGRTRRPSPRGKRGNWRDEHLFAPRQALERYDALLGQIAGCEERINGELVKLARDDVDDPPEDKRSRKGRDRELRRLKRMLGVDLPGHSDRRRRDGASHRPPRSARTCRGSRRPGTSVRGWVWRRAPASAATRA